MVEENVETLLRVINLSFKGSGSSQFDALHVVVEESIDGLGGGRDVGTVSGGLMEIRWQVDESFRLVLTIFRRRKLALRLGSTWPGSLWWPLWWYRRLSCRHLWWPGGRWPLVQGRLVVLA